MNHIIIILFYFTLNVFCFQKNDESIMFLKSICTKQRLFDIYNIKKITFTFNAQLPDKIINRHWEWQISTNRILLDGKEHTESQKFINDIYWLLFPLKVYEDKSKTEILANRNSIAPISHKNSTELLIKYSDGKGYTPNDTYKLYLNENGIITEWSYLQGGKEPPIRTTTWENYTEINGVTLSLLRKGSGSFKVWFTDITIEK